ncbi:MAG TPA: hypothetical protein VF593_02365 [Chthoniobacteraceae bacterium]
MKKFSPLLFLFLAVTMAAGLAWQHREIRALRQQAAESEQLAAQARARAEENAARIGRLSEQLASYKAELVTVEERNKTLAAGGSAERAAEAVPAGDLKPEETKAKAPGDFMKSVAKMYSDPKMKEMMKSQQKVGINMMYSGLAKELGLAPDEAREVLDLLAERQVETITKVMGSVGKEGEAAEALVSTAAKDKEATEAHEAQLRRVLGGERYAQFQDYEKTLGERMAIREVSNQLAAGGTPLEEGQSSGLLQIMKEERLRTVASPLDGRDRNPANQIKALQSEDAVNRWEQSQQDFNRRVLERARTVLSPDQVLALEASQKQQFQMQQMGMKMGREMMGGK